MPPAAPVSSTFRNAANERFFAEKVQWSPRDLRRSSVRGDQNGRGWEATYDPAGRLVLAETKVGTPAGGLEPSSSPGLPETFGFSFDAAQNLLTKSEQKACEADVDALPLDGSGRNRPATADGVPLEWDAAGNLIRKGDQRFTYDYRNRLTRVLGPGGQEVAAYVYDAFNRRLQKHVAGMVEDTVWANWRPIEVYRNSALYSRRTYGLGLDEIVAVEQDLDGVGGPEREYLPIWDSSGNLAMVTDSAGKPIEKYAYSPSATAGSRSTTRRPPSRSCGWWATRSGSRLRKRSISRSWSRRRKTVASSSPTTPGAATPR